MAYHQRGRGGRRMGNEFERQLFQSCYNLGVGFPPNPQEVWPKLQFFKNLGQECLNQGDLRPALNHYVVGLQAAELFPGHPQYREERTKILCNMSLVLFRMRRFKDAEENAVEAIATEPNFVKGYWRAYQAVIGGRDGPQTALPYISEGLRRSMGGAGTTQDVIAFLVELCSFIPSISNNGITNEVLEQLMIPDPSEKDIWTKTLQKIPGNHKWDSLRMLVLGNSGPMCELRGICRDLNMSFLDIGALLEMQYINLKIWGIALAERLLEQGAPVDNIGIRFRKPSVHVGVEISLKTDSVRLLESILRCYSNKADAINAQDENSGETAFHCALQSDQALQPIVERILEVLLKHGCDPNVKDKHGKRPIDYVLPGTSIFRLLKKASKSVEELKQELESLKKKGNDALKRGQRGEALKLYEQALEISKQSKELYKEAAIVYSNTAKVLVDMKDLKGALPNAIAAISCDKTYHKGHNWKGKVLCQMGVFQDGFSAYIDGFTYAVISSDIKLSFLTEAVLVLQHLNQTERRSSYSQLQCIDGQVWPLALQKLASSAEWKGVAYLILGHNLEQKQFKTALTEEKIKKLNSGIAGNCSMTHLDLRTVFMYLQRRDFCLEDVYWLDVLLVAIYRATGVDRLAADDKDTTLHAVAKFGLISGRTGLVHEVLKRPLHLLNQQFLNGIGDSVFHTITKTWPLPEENALVKVTQAFLDKGFSAMVKDRMDKLAVEYLNETYSGYAFDIFFQKVVSFSWNRVNVLKEEGNQKYKSGDILDAIELYTEAIDQVESQSKIKLREKPARDIAVLYGNRAEGYLKMGYYELALDDAKRSVSYSGHWYKAHLRTAKALQGLKRLSEAQRAYINAYTDVETTEEKVRIEILVELTLVCSQMPKDLFNPKVRLKQFPEGQGHVWVKTSYDLIRKDEWQRACIAYHQFKLSPGRPTHISYPLTPVCKLKKMSSNPWAVDLIRYFLDCGADRRTLTLSQGDTYLHAAVRICLVVETSGMLLETLLKTYKEVHLLDRDGNTALHTASKEKSVVMDTRYNIIMKLIKANVDPNVRNVRSEQAIDLLPQHETKNTEILRMAMFRGNVQGPVSNVSNQQGARSKTPAIVQPPKPIQILKKTCEECQDLLTDAQNAFDEEKVPEGYNKLTEIFKMKQHKAKKHEELVNKALNSIVDKLGEKSIPEISPCLTSMSKEYFQRVIDGLILKKRWKQLHMIVRKYRFEKGSDQLKGFASNLSIVPVIDDPVFKDQEDEQMQIIANMLNSGASKGTDNGQTALTHAKGRGHFKLVADLIKRDADTSHFTLTSGDTPIHAIVSLVLEREKGLSLLEFVTEQYENDPDNFPHLNPCQQTKAGDSLFHLVAKGKCSTICLKVTEFLCKGTLSAGYYNKEGKLPIHYITKKNDRRLQYIRLAAAIEPVGKQKFGPDMPPEPEDDGSSGDEMNDYSRKDEVGNAAWNFMEKVKQESERDQMKRRIEELIRILPDSKPARPTVQLNISVNPNEEPLKDIEDHHKDKGDSERADKTVSKGSNDNQNYNDSELSKANNKPEMKEAPKDLNDLKVSNETEADHTLRKDELEHKNQCSDETEVVNEDSHESTEEDSERVVHDHHEDNNKQDLDETKIAVDTETQRDMKENSEQITHDHMETETTAHVDDIHAEIVLEDIEANDAIKVEEDIESESEDEEDEGKEEEFDAEIFDNLEWEVECTAEVWKTLQDKHVRPGLKNRIMRKIKLLASGDWQPVLCKKLRNVPKAIDLFEAKFSKGSRIIWEKAIAFSPRCSETAERRLQMDTDQTTQPVRGGRIYSEIIRVWEIVFDHDKIHRSVERIKQSHHRGEDCYIQKKLRGIKTDSSQLSLTQGCRIYPKMFAENDVPAEKIVEQHEEMHQYFPPASSNETEYHILKFYSFSSTLVSHVLQNLDTKVDFPFRVTDLEHAIINLASKAPILLLGRSGTGKTTCCLYRLWSQFLRYWIKAKEADAPLIPRSIEFIHSKEENGDQGEEHDDSQDDQSDSEEGACGQSTASSSDQNNRPITDHYDHIHQLFITKNLVLCSEVQKNFHELSHADSMMNEHVQHEEEELPNKLQEVGDYSYPLFLTSRQLLMMLDASIGEPYFFNRKEDGSLKADVAGWSDDGPLSVLSLLEEDSDNEAEEGYAYDEDEQDDEDPEILQTTARKNKVDPRREITYHVFVEEVWPKIKKKMNYHPSLIWTEIMSFIKGSFEALSKASGYLALEDYLKLGKKRAPNFSAEREPIHQFFKRYEHFKKQNRLFDETDLVYNIYKRLRLMGNRPWVIHQVYVDETQDFTQAELCLLMRMCQNPNDMFLTGDTAQSIMRGISFRFNDLRSLFFHAKKSMKEMGKTSAVEVPKKVYQLTHNYRSHAGILSLASSVLDLMVEFFPESFDRLQHDQGLFSGPQPILLESCSFSDLAVLLRGNKRKTSHIEFGAHQAILVVNEAARDAIPEELRLGLVLTIYEAKGLEFDDVLLYNFFKDSQAVKEWRVVTQYLEHLLSNQRELDVQDGQQESLVEIDEGVLNQEGRPRPLDFDSNLHKVLNSELKHLYTALTRARVNVWIFDEDVDKRAPMFEYFNARRLVKSVTVSEINEESLAETVFAEKSTKDDWIRRGEDFMRHSLYIVAAKCFGMAGDLEKEKVALAHVQALKASRLKENPREMCREFLKAAEMYLNCYKPAKAAICLQNARERELAAELFEKLGQYERAGDIYKKLKLSIASSRCYEQLGHFNKAMEVLYDNENYDMAMDTLKRYKMRIKDYAQKNLAVPGQLVAYKPADYYTEEKLSHRAAEKFHKLGNTERMLSAIDSIPKVSDRVEFLKKNGLIRQAAEKLKENGDLMKAIQLLLMHGYLEEATAVAKTMDDEATRGYCILVSCRVLVAKTKEDSDFPVEIPAFQQKELLKTIAEGIALLEVSQRNDEFGELRLLQAEISMNRDLVKQAWKAFSGSKPVPNDAGLVECARWLIEHTQLAQVDTATIKRIINGVGQVFSICGALSRPNEASNYDKVNKYLQFYGLIHYSQSELELHPKERPHCLILLRHLIGNIDMDKQSCCRLNKDEAHQTIMKYLLKRTITWVDKIWEVLFSMRNKHRVCSSFQAGLECPDMGNVDNNCSQLHRPMTQENIKTLIEIDHLMTEFEGEIQEGACRLKKVCPPKLRELVEKFLAEGERDSSEKYKACWMLLDDLMPFSGHPNLINDDSGELVKYLQRNNKVLSHVREFLKEQWKVKTTNQNKSSRCQATKETEIFLLFEFGYHLFGLDVRYKIEPSPVKSVQALERAIDAEGGPRKEGLRYLTLVTYTDRGRTYYEFTGKRFMEAYSYMSSYPNPYEAVFQFSKFVILQRRCASVSQLPDLHHYTMWLEFYLTVAFIITAKLKAIYFPDFLFILPSNYLALIKFVEATFPNPNISRVLSGIDRLQPPQRNQTTWMKQLQDRVKFISFGVCGFGHISILKEALQRSLGDPFFYAVAERIIVLQMLLVLNIGKAMPVECENSLMKSLSQFQIPPEGPDRLQRLAKYLQQNVKGIADVGAALTSLLKTRQQGEELLICNWEPRSKQRLVTSKLETDTLFSKTFFNPKTLDAMHDRTHIYHTEDGIDEEVMDDQLTEEEIDKSVRDKRQQEENERLNRAATRITRFFRRIVGIKQARRYILGRKRELVRGDFRLFESVMVTDKHCGYCGLYFETKVAERLEYEQSLIVGAQSVINPSSIGVAADSSLTTPMFTMQQELPSHGAWGRSVSIDGRADDNGDHNHQSGNIIATPNSPELGPEGDRYNKIAWERQASNERRFDLKTIKQEHLQQPSHLTTKEEYERFEKKCKTKILPKLEVIREFFDNSDYQLSNKEFAETTYEHRYMEIERVQQMLPKLDTEILELFKTRQWSSTGTIEQLMTEIGTQFEIVRPYVEEINNKEKEKDEGVRQSSSSSSATNQHNKEPLEDEDGFEEVVDEPGKRRKGRVFRNSKGRGRRGRRQ